MLAVMLLLLQVPPIEAPPTAAEETPKIEPLWQQMTYGMSPADVVAALSATTGIKSAKLRGTSKVSISYVGDGMPIAGLSFKVSPIFERGALTSVALTAEDVCANTAQGPIDQIMEGLQSRHGAAPLLSVEDKSNVDRALLRSYSTGLPVEVGNAVVGASVATSVILTVTNEQPSYYTGTSRGLAGSLGALSNALAEGRGEECGGQGFNRVNILLVYQRKGDFEAGIAETMRANEAKREETKDAL